MAQSVLKQIESLDAQKDHQEIVRLITAYEYPFLMQKSLEFALFRTYAVPTVGALLDQTKHFERAGQKRYDDTGLMIAEWVENGYDSERGRAALRRMNQLHHQWPISNDDFLYVLSVFVYIPKYWFEMYGTRHLTEKENQALYYYWAEVGRRMAIKDIPETAEAFEAFHRQYERDHFAYNDASRRVADATIQVFLNWYPAFSRPMVKQGIYALLDEPLRQAFGYPQPSPVVRALTLGGLKLAAKVIRLFPPRTAPYRRTKEPNRTYPEGYEIDKLGAHPPIAE